MLNQNMHGISVAFSMVDAHLFIHRRIANDQFRHCVRSMPVRSDEVDLVDNFGFTSVGVQTVTHGSEIDFDWYARQWEGAQTIMGLFSWLKTLVDVKKQDAKPVVKTDDFEFGGDYAAQPNP